MKNTRPMGAIQKIHSQKKMGETTSTGLTIIGEERRRGR